MVPAEPALRLLAGVLLILANGFFVAIEFALTRVRQYPEDAFDQPGLRRAWAMTEDLEIYLTSCQVGITASSIALGIVAEPALAALLHPLFAGTPLAAAGAGGVLAFVIINLAHLTHGEQTPTYLGVERTKFVCRYGATPLYAFTWVIKPVIEIGDHVAKWTLKLFGVEMTGAWLETGTEVIRSRAELRNRLDALLARGELTEERREEIVNALEVGDRRVEEIMTPRDEITVLSTDRTVEENLERIASTGYSRFPLVRGSLDAFVGIVYVPSLVAVIDDLREGRTSLEALAAPPMTLPADLTISEAIDRFQDEHQELALVVEDDTVVGLVTATDALEAVMGEIEDPLDVAVGQPTGSKAG